MKKLLAVFVLIVNLGVIGCKTLPETKTPAPQARVYQKEYTRAWNALMALLTNGRYVVTTADKNSGLIQYDKRLTRQQVKKYALEKAPMFPIGCTYGEGTAHVNIYMKRLSERTTSIKVDSQIETNLQRVMGEHVEEMRLDTNTTFEHDTFWLIEAAVGKN
jgi:hypothetical protein